MRDPLVPRLDEFEVELDLELVAEDQLVGAAGEHAEVDAEFAAAQGAGGAEPDVPLVLPGELLGAGPRRFTEPRREIEAISQRMLTLTLRKLERDGLVQRTVYPVVAPRVEYRLTELGRTLLESIQSIVNWTLTHRGEITAARAAYDARDGVVMAGDRVIG